MEKITTMRLGEEHERMIAELKQHYAAQGWPLSTGAILRHALLNLHQRHVTKTKQPR